MSEIQQLSLEQKIQLVEDLWDSIAIDSTDLPVTEKQRVELDKRLARLDRDGHDSIDAREYLADLRSRL